MQHASGCGFGPSLALNPSSTLNRVRATQSRSLGVTTVCTLMEPDGVELFRVDPASSAPVPSSSMITAGSPAHPRFDSPSSAQEPPSLDRVQVCHASKFCVPGPEELFSPEAGISSRRRHQDIPSNYTSGHYFGPWIVSRMMEMLLHQGDLHLQGDRHASVFR